MPHFIKLAFKICIPLGAVLRDSAKPAVSVSACFSSWVFLVFLQQENKGLREILHSFHQLASAIYEIQSTPPADTDHAGTLNLDFPSPKAVKNEFLVFIRYIRDSMITSSRGLDSAPKYCRLSARAFQLLKWLSQWLSE